jgi:hypothetical protein
MEKPSASLEERVKVLEAALIERERQIIAFTGLVRSWAKRPFPGNPMEDFFAHPEDWEIIIPIDPPNQCYLDCLDYSEQLFARCNGLEGDAAAECRRDALERSNDCVGGCPAPKLPTFPF